jgi:hypothetical protein
MIYPKHHFPHGLPLNEPFLDLEEEKSFTQRRQGAKTPRGKEMRNV